MKLSLRVNEAHELDFHYEQAVDYPVDLYYLMDLSKSMEDDKEKLSTLGDLLSETMQNLTSNFRLGFGSFVDKVVMPYVSTVPQKVYLLFFIRLAPLVPTCFSWRSHAKVAPPPTDINTTCLWIPQPQTSLGR